MLDSTSRPSITGKYHPACELLPEELIERFNPGWRDLYEDIV